VGTVRSLGMMTAPIERRGELFRKRPVNASVSRSSVGALAARLYEGGRVVKGVRGVSPGVIAGLPGEAGWVKRLLG